MNDFRLLNLSDDFLYWYEVASYIAPYATIGSFNVGGLALQSENRQEERLAEISKRLDEIKTLVTQTYRALEQKLNDIPVKERSGEVLGIEEALNEFRRLRSQGILDNIVSDSAQTKRKIKTYIDAKETPVEFRATYCGLYATLLPLRVAAFQLFDRPITEINQLVKEELLDLVDIESVMINSTETVGSNRVSPVISKDFLFDELGPTFGTMFSARVDNKARNLGTFLPRNTDLGDLNEIRKRAHDSRDKLATNKATEAAAPFRKVLEATKLTIGKID